MNTETHTPSRAHEPAPNPPQAATPAGPSQQVAQRAEPIARVLPPVDIVETDEAYVLVADVPGLSPESIDIQLDRERLTLSAVSRVDGLAPVHYERSFRVMRGLDPDAIVAAYRDGVLSVTLPRPQSAEPRRIAVNAG